MGPTRIGISRALCGVMALAMGSFATAAEAPTESASTTGQLTKGSPEAVPMRWNYDRNPVRATENHPRSDYWAAMFVVANAFDGYGTAASLPGCGRGWRGEMPSAKSPQVCVIDYGKPVPVSAFAHYFYVPGCRDLRYEALGPSAFKRMRISVRNEESAEWSEMADLRDLPEACPQVLAVPNPRPARYWKLEVMELAAGAESLCSYEIETYTGGIPAPPSADPAPDLPAAFAQRMRTHEPSGGRVHSELTLSTAAEGLHLELRRSGAQVTGDLQFDLGAKPCILHPVKPDSWTASGDQGALAIQSHDTPMGVLLELKYNAKDDAALKYAKVAVQLKAPDASLYYEPGFNWSREPLNAMASTHQKPTRMVALGTQKAMLCMVSGTDRGQSGFEGKAAVNAFVVGPAPTPVLLTMVPGDWWAAYQFTVKEVYDFGVRPMVYPGSEMQYAASKHLMSEEVWDPVLGTSRIPNRSDREKKQTRLFECYHALNFYGVYSSIPAYCSRWIMSEDAAALQRCRSIVHWLCSSGVRVKDGPCRGAFFSEQRFAPDEKSSMEKQGQDWMNKPRLVSYSTGSALWSLLYYKHVTGDDNPEANTAIQEAADWLLKTQDSNGGWPYCHDLEGHAMDGTTWKGRQWKDMPTSGSIWSIRALWRMGQETGDGKYLDAAERATEWFTRRFINKHHYNGYWEDIGPGSAEGYEAGIAAIVFREMGKKDLALTAARDAAQWVVTRQVEYRDGGSLGHFPEQQGWTLGSYLCATMSLAMYESWRETGDEFWRPYFMSTRAAVCDLYSPELGAFFWSDHDGLAVAPIVGGRHFEDGYTWADYFDAQEGMGLLLFAVKEVARRSGGQIQLDEETLHGTALGQPVKAWTPSGGFRPIPPIHGQMEWLGLKSGDSVMIALLNDGAPGEAFCPLERRDVNGAELRPKAVHTWANGRVETRNWDGKSQVPVAQDGLSVLEWSIR